VSAAAQAATARVHVHVGLPKTGTTAIQRVFAAHRRELADEGFLYPDLGPEGMFHAAVEVIGWGQWGLDPTELAGTWAAHCALVRAHDGPSLLSHEVLGRARRHQVRAALAELEGADVHLVVTARDLARQVTATWQERVKNGRRYTFEEFLDREGVVGAAPGEPRRGAFWREQDLVGVLTRWGRRLPPERVHVVVCPPPGAPRDELVRRFGSAVGVDLTRFGPVEDLANRSLAAPQVELLRRVNLRLHDRLSGEEYVRVVKRWFVPRLLAGMDGPRLLAPDRLREPFLAITDEWRSELADRGYRVHGDPADLEPVTFDTPGDELARVSWRVDQGSELLAELLLSVAELRHGRSAVTQEPPGTIATRLRRGLGKLGRTRLRRLA
jgi:hypothetical protein